MSHLTSRGAGRTRMLSPVVNEFGLILSSPADGTQPALAFGTSVTAGNNVYGAYAQLFSGAAVTDDVYGIWLGVNSTGTSAQAKDTILTLGLDAAGGTSYTDTIVDLIFSESGAYGGNRNSSGIYYFFPLFIKAGTSIGAKLSVNNATPGTGRVTLQLYCRPSHPELIRVGSTVTTYGSVPGASAGTGITAGTAAEGAWLQLGTVANPPPFFWQAGLGVNTGTAVVSANHVDLALGDVTNKKTAIQNALVILSDIEVMQADYRGAFMQSAVGDGIWVRVQQSAAQANLSAVAYGLS